MPQPSPTRLAAATLLAAAISISGLAARSAEPQGAAVDGVWDATVQIKDAAVPFKLRLSGDADHVKATYFDGERPVQASTGGTLKDGQLHVEFASYASKLDAHLDAEGLKGA